MKLGLRKHVVVTLLVLSMVLSGAAVASAHGYVFVGATSLSDAGGLDTAIAVEYSFTPELAVSVEHYPTAPTYSHLQVRYGVGTGGYGYVGLDSDGIDSWGVGGFFERRVTDKLDARVYAGIVSIVNDEIRPDAWAELRYALSGPWALMGMASLDYGEVGIGFEF